MILPNNHHCKVSIIGLGYVGLPLAIAIANNTHCLITKKKTKRIVIGYDINKDRIDELNKGYDKTNEILNNDLRKQENILFTSDEKLIIQSDIFIITVPTPVDSLNKPDLSYVENASKLVGRAIKQRDNIKNSAIVIYESTFFPGATEEVCIPIIERESNLTLNSTKSSKGFFCGYSPERINPGDKKHCLINIKKVTSGSNKEAAIWINNFYSSFIKAGTHLAPNIKVAEAAKIIENTQRDINIALINELAIIFKMMNIDTLDVLKAASTKWNFHTYEPGLVGGHCIGVDPYYLTYKAESLGYSPEMVLAGRKINDNMARWVAEQLILEMTKKGLEIKGKDVLVLGITFKENCPDIRNTKVISLINSLSSFNLNPIIVDPCADQKKVLKEYNIKLYKDIPNQKYSAIIIAVGHKEFFELSINDWEKYTNNDTLILDIKGIVPRSMNPIRI